MGGRIAGQGPQLHSIAWNAISHRRSAAVTGLRQYRKDAVRSCLRHTGHGWPVAAHDARKVIPRASNSGSTLRQNFPSSPVADPAHGPNTRLALLHWKPMAS